MGWIIAGLLVLISFQLWLLQGELRTIRSSLIRLRHGLAATGRSRDEAVDMIGLPVE